MGGILVLIFTLIYLALLVLMVVSLIFYAIGLQTMAKNEGLNHTWLAWIPIFNYYLIGELVKDRPLIKSGKRHLTITLVGVVLAIASLVVIDIVLMDNETTAVIGFLAWFFVYMIFVVYLWIGHYYLLAKYTKHALLLTLLSLFVSQLILQFSVYVLRNKQPLTPKTVETEEPVTDYE